MAKKRKGDLSPMSTSEFRALCAEHTVVTVEEYAAVLRVHPDTVLHMIRREDLPARRIGQRWLITSEAALGALGITLESA